MAAGLAPRRRKVRSELIQPIDRCLGMAPTPSQDSARTDGTRVWPRNSDPEPIDDPLRAADLAAALLRQRGADASRHALRCAEICLIRGQSAGYAAWRLVLRAIERLEGAGTADDPAIDDAFVAGPLDPLLRARDAAT